jgi:UDP-N-acetylmuramoyl-L-alanyl-D-glutamate--2,6-diaminopimelate ligase
MAMCVVNIDDDTGKYIANNCGIKCITCSTCSIADFAVVDVKKSDSGQIIYLKNSNTVYAIKTNMIGKFNVYNLVEAIAVGKQLGIDMDTMISAIKNMGDIPGRCNRYLIGGKQIIIDFAHTPKNILIRAVLKGSQSNKAKEKALTEVRSAIKEFNVNPTLYNLLFNEE